MTLKKITPLSVILVSSMASLVHAADLTITITEIQNPKGEVYVAVYDSEQSYLNLPQAKAKLMEKPKDGRVVLVVHDLPAGRYAVASFQDLNGNAELDKNGLGVPQEPYGFSNDAIGLAGPPKFNKAAFNVDGKADKAVSFSLHN